MSISTSLPRRVLGAGVVVAALTALSVVVPVTAANAGPAALIADLQTELNAGGTAYLVADINAPTSLLSVPVDVTLNLNGFDLATGSTSIATGVTLTVVDVATGGSWTSAEGSGAQRAGIRTTGATLIVDGAVITATGGPQAAGIGGGYEQSGGTVIVNSGSVTATSPSQGAGIGGGWSWSGGSGGDGGTTTVNGGTVIATGGGYASGIGGGYYGNGGTTTITGGSVIANAGFRGAGIGGGTYGSGGIVSITGGSVVATGGEWAAAIGGAPSGFGTSGAAVLIGAGAVVTAQTDGSNTAVGGGNDGAFGSLTVEGTLTIPTGSYLGVPSAGTATIASTGVVDGGGDLRGGGSIVNNGIILNSTVANLADGAGLDVSVHDYRVAFDGNYAGAASTPVRVYAPTFDTGNRTFPADPTRPNGYSFDGWNTAADGSGTVPTESTALTADATYFAQWTGYELTPTAQTVTAGGSVHFAVEETPGNTDVTADFTFTSDNAADIVTDEVVDFTEAGTRTITATLDSDPTVTRTATITVAAAAPATLTLIASDLSVDQGDTISLDITAEDAYGNDVPTTGVVVTSNYATDVIVGSTVRFPTASTHVITATLGGVSAQVSVAVAPAVANLPRAGTDSATPFGAAAILLLLGAAAIVLRRRFNLR